VCSLHDTSCPCREKFDMTAESREGKTIKSAFESSTFDADISIHVDTHHGDCGSATISPSGRDVAIAS